MKGVHITYVLRHDATPQAELSVLASVYRLILDSKKAAPRQSSSDDAIVGNKKGVSHVDRRPN